MDEKAKLEFLSPIAQKILNQFIPVYNGLLMNNNCDNILDAVAPLLSLAVTIASSSSPDIKKLEQDYKTTIKDTYGKIIDILNDESRGDKIPAYDLIALCIAGLAVGSTTLSGIEPMQDIGNENDDTDVGE